MCSKYDKCISVKLRVKYQATSTELSNSHTLRIRHIWRTYEELWGQIGLSPQKECEMVWICSPVRLWLNCFMHYSYIMSCTPEHVQNAVVDVWLDKLARLQWRSLPRPEIIEACGVRSPTEAIQWPQKRLLWKSWHQKLSFEQLKGDKHLGKMAWS